MNYSTKWKKDEELAAKLIYYALIKSVIKILRVLPHDMKKNICILLSGESDSRVLTYVLSRKVSDFKALTFGTIKKRRNIACLSCS